MTVKQSECDIPGWGGGLLHSAVRQARNEAIVGMSFVFASILTLSFYVMVNYATWIGTWLVPGTWYLVLGTWYLVPGTWYLAPDWYLVPDTWIGTHATWIGGSVCDKLSSIVLCQSSKGNENKTNKTTRRRIFRHLQSSDGNARLGRSTITTEWKAGRETLGRTLTNDGVTVPR